MMFASASSQETVDGQLQWEVKDACSRRGTKAMPEGAGWHSSQTTAGPDVGYFLFHIKITFPLFIII